MHNETTTGEVEGGEGQGRGGLKEEGWVTSGAPHGLCPVCRGRLKKKKVLTITRSRNRIVDESIATARRSGVFGATSTERARVMVNAAAKLMMGWQT